MKIDSNKLDSNINSVCSDCGKEAMKLQENMGKRSFQVSTFHKAVCDVCKEIKLVTQTRDYMYPIFDIKETSK